MWVEDNFKTDSCEDKKGQGEEGRQNDMSLKHKVAQATDTGLLI